MPRPTSSFSIHLTHAPAVKAECLELLDGVAVRRAQMQADREAMIG